MKLGEAKKILENSEKHSSRLVEEAKEVVERFSQRGEKPMKQEIELKRGGKVQMAYGGTVMGKRHMYVAGGSVKMNPGLRALRKSSPEAFAKITKGKKVTT